jgi:hypothetical protein
MTEHKTLKEAMALQDAMKQVKGVDLSVGDIVRICVNAGFIEVIERNNFEFLFGERAKNEIQAIKEEELQSELKGMDQEKKREVLKMRRQAKHEDELESQIKTALEELKTLRNLDLVEA